MRTLSLVATFALAAAVAQADPPTITSVAPQSGPPSGGTVVHVTGTNLIGRPTLCPAITCSTYALFGDRVVAPQTGSDTDMFFVTPPHAPGVVDFTVYVAGSPGIPICGGFHYDNLDARWVRVLLPVLANATPGAHGSVWQSEVTFNSLQETDIRAICTNPIISPCPGILHLSTAADVPLDAAFLAGYRGPGFVHIPTGTAENVSINARIRDLSQSDRDFGTEVPVVRDRDFRERVRLLSIPTDARFRLTLRVYSLGGLDATAHIRIFPEGSQNTVIDTTRILTNGVSGALPYAPAWSEIALDTIYPQIMTGHRIRIEIEPLGGLPIWGFVSVTNNETQHVTLVTPQ